MGVVVAVGVGVVEVVEEEVAEAVGGVRHMFAEGVQ